MGRNARLTVTRLLLKQNYEVFRLLPHCVMKLILLNTLLFDERYVVYQERLPCKSTYTLLLKYIVSKGVNMKY